MSEVLGSIANAFGNLVRKERVVAIIVGAEIRDVFGADERVQEQIRVDVDAEKAFLWGAEVVVQSADVGGQRAMLVGDGGSVEWADLRAKSTLTEG